MENTMKKLIIILTVLFTTVNTQADIVIKDWQLGLDKKQIKQVKKANKLCGKGKFSFVNTGRKKCNLVIKGLLTGQMTLANEYISMPHVDYTDGKATTLVWYFYHAGQHEAMPSFNYPQFVEAFKNKYPAMTCEAHITQTRVGAEYQDETCTLEIGEQALIIEKYASNVDHGTVVLTDIKSLTTTVAQDQKQANQDL